MIHSELLTHRIFSRNASSSRAIPISKMIEWIESDPAIPIYWGSSKRGMQAGAEIENIGLAIAIWNAVCHAVVGSAKVMACLGLHKQIVNRILEPWAHMNVVLTGTEFDNFFTLRCHPDAQPEIQKLAVMMAIAFRDSEPTLLQNGEWHLPYVTAEEKASLPLDVLKKICVARCCRVSYLTVDGKSSAIEKDLELHDGLLTDHHMSPFEHAAEADDDRWYGNFRGFRQYRQAIPLQSYLKFDFSTLDKFPKGFHVAS